MKLNSISLVQMKSQIVLLILLITWLPSCLAAAAPAIIPLFRTQVFGYDTPETTTSTSSLLNDLKTFFYNQTIDHFTYSPESYQTFSQRYYVKTTNWGGANSPIFVYLGDEQSLELEVGGTNLGFLEENAPKFKALTVYIEHRFYGKSNPLGSMEQSIKNRKVRGYFNSAQALADFAEIILYLKKQYGATQSPVIVFGVSYGGMLATWFRLKYPHIALGALASSAPILKHVVSNDAYLQVVTKDYKDTSENCYKTIRESWTQIINLGSQMNAGLSILNKKINTCSPLSMQTILYDLLFPTYIRAAQYDFPPYYPVASLCKGIDGAPKGADAIDKVYAGLLSLFGNITCFTGSEASQVPAVNTSDTTIGWPWQVCSEMFSFGAASVNMNDTETMFPMILPYDPKRQMQSCQAAYGVLPRPNWLQSYYGGQDIKLVLKRFGSNIIFSNGLRDPYSTSGVLQDLSDTLLAISTPQGAHGLDMRRTFTNDPEWLIAMRNKEVEAIQGWLTQYSVDLNSQ